MTKTECPIIWRFYNKIVRLCRLIECLETPVAEIVSDGKIKCNQMEDNIRFKGVILLAHLS